MRALTPDVERWREAGDFIEIGGHRVFVLDTNSHPGDFVFVLHGFPSSSFDWYRVVPELAKHTRVLTFDFLGYGLSDKPFDARYSLFEQADLAEAIAADRGVRRCTLVTHDMGQTVGAELVKRQLDGDLAFEITGTVVTNGSTLIDLAELSSGQQLLLSLPDEPLEASLDLDGFAPGLRETFSSEHQPPEAELEAMLALLRHNDGDRILPRLIRYVEERRANIDRWTSGLVDFEGPQALIWGEQDPIAVVEMAHRLKELRPASDLTTWPDVGHWPSIEVPERLAEAIVARL